MWKHAIWVMAMLVLLPVAHAQQEVADAPPASDAPAAEKPTTPAEQFEALQQEYAQARAEFGQAYSAAQTDEERQQVVDDKYPRPQKFVGRFLEFAEAHPDDPAAVEALVWVVTNGQGTDEAGKALSVLATDHVQSDKLGPVCQRLMYSRDAPTETFLRNVAKNSPHHEVQGYAYFSLAKVLQYRGGEESVEESETLLERIVNEFDDVKTYRGTLADRAETELYELRFLAIGKVAPEIEGEDIDGVAFKLSDYRGKVVVLDFWGHW